MKRRIISMIMILTLIFTTLNIQAFATPKHKDNDKGIQLVKEVYKNLTPEAKKKLINFLEAESDNGKSKLLDYHKKHVDTKYKRTNKKIDIEAYEEVKDSAISTASTLNISYIGLPWMVEYTCYAIASALGSQWIPGAGQVVAIIVAIGAVAVFAYYWDDISEKWPLIVYEFKSAFNSMASTIESAFNDIYMMAQGLPTNDEFKNYEYHYGEHAHEFADMPGGNGKKPDKDKWWEMAKEFLKKTGSNIKDGTSNKISHYRIKFNTVTLEYLVYNPVTGQIISYYLPKHDSYKNGTYALWQWKLKAFEFFKANIR